jgi:hypothetical protein
VTSIAVVPKASDAEDDNLGQLCRTTAPPLREEPGKKRHALRCLYPAAGAQNSVRAPPFNMS